MRPEALRRVRRGGLLTMGGGALLLVAGGALRDAAWSGPPALARVAAVVPLLGLGAFATGWLIVGSGHTIRGSRLLAVSAAVALYEVVGVLVVVIGEVLAFGGSIVEQLREIEVLGVAQLWPIVLLFDLQILGYGPR